MEPMTMAMIGGAALGGLGGLFGKKKSTTSTAVNEPWKVQQPFLQGGFQQGQDALNRGLEIGPYQGPFTAGSNPNLDAGFDRTVNWSNTAGGFGDTLAGTGMAGVNAFEGVVGNSQNLFNRAGVDPTQATLAGASAYADNPYTQGMVDGALRDVNRNLQTGIAQNNANAVGSGNINSTRAGVTEALLTTAAADRAADISAGIRGNAYDRGLALSANQQQQGFTNQLAANQQGLAGASAGASLVNQGLTTGLNAANAQTGVGMAQRGLENEMIQGNIQGNEYARNTDLDLIRKYMQIVGGNYGGTQTTTAQNPNTPFGSAMQGVIGGASMGAGLGRMFGGSVGGASGFPVQMPGTFATGYGNFVSPQYAQYYP
ncbi:hypothetical protein UFOVP730_3 [uncultured Caudovirales phage]|uniref:Uncharacterized protein n=1 Tax=uncultured Caudovirales phage TaxID=2100421 RepID=A0A6J5NPE3_9CAUD|nr:hypothetical protein UFOVP730_3 [uncultured Caudovirales phage]